MFKIKLLILKTIDKIFRMLGRGSSITGYISLKFKFDILNYVNLNNHEVIFVIGTNGKTTTANLISDCLSKNKKVINNSEGANLLAGILTILIRNLGFNQEIDGDIIVLEVDEKTVSQIIKYVKPKKVVITNFFRDQLDRYGEIDSIVADIINTLDDADIEIHLNGCDPLMIHKFRNNSNPIKLYGLDQNDKSTALQNKIVELKYCPKCLKVLDYDYYHYGHIGYYNCVCGFKQNNLDTNLFVDYKNNLIQIDDKEINVDTDKFPLYYYFNIAATISIIKMYDKDYDVIIKDIFKNFKFPKGRSQYFELDDKTIYLNLVKNVVGFEESIDYIIDKFDKTDLLILFNDNYADGRDVSWIWDTHILDLKKHVNNIYIGGIRRYDMAMRFEFDNFDNIHVYDEENLYNLVKDHLSKLDNNLAIISNYTPLVDVSNALNNYMEEYENSK